jgi:formate--tetrahydrofolate ligase
VTPGKPLPAALLQEDPEAVAAGAANLQRMIGIVQRTGIPAIVAINRFPQDTDRELDVIRGAARSADGVEVIEAFAKGGKGAEALATLVDRACQKPATFRPFYDSAWPITKKIETIAKEVYGADGVDYSERAEGQIQAYTRWGLDRLPICMAKTHLSLSHDSHRKGAPTGFRIPIKEVRASAGAGFLYPLVGEIMTMPGLGSVPGGEHMDIDDRGNLVGFAD